MLHQTAKLLDRFVTDLSEATSMSLVQQELEVPVPDKGARQARLDARLLMMLPIGDRVELAVDVMKTAYPRDIHMAIQRLCEYEASRPHSPVPLELCVLADYLSPGSRQKLKEAGINYFDGTGSMYFKHRTYLVVKECQPNTRAQRRPVKLFTGAREQVVHALLEHWRQTEGIDYISGAELAERAQTSSYTVSQTMQALEREEWVETIGSGPSQRRRVRNADALLDAWANDWESRREQLIRWFAFERNPGVLPDLVLSKLAGRFGWALTGAAAANAVVPHLSTVDRVKVIVPPWQGQAWGEELGFKPADKGANIVFVEREGASLMFLDEHPERPGSCFAGRFIQYLDLLDGYGRNKELAAEYRRVALHLGPRQ